jgi:hypothetical protein
MSNELVVQKANKLVGFNNQNERILQRVMAMIESVAIHLESRDDLCCFGDVLHEAVRQLCEIEVK